MKIKKKTWICRGMVPNIWPLAYDTVKFQIQELGRINITKTYLTTNSCALLQ